MALSLSFTIPQVIGDNIDPLTSYVSQSFTVLPGQLYVNFSTGDLFCIKDCSSQNDLVWNKVYAGSPSGLATVAFTGSYTDLINNPVASYSSPNFTSVTTATQLSTTRDASVVYVFPTSMTSLLTSQSLTATLQYADDSGITTNVVTPCVDIMGCSGILSLTLVGRLQVSARIPAGKYRKVTLSQTGGATIPTTISSSQEVLLG
jgi:hypothetical protein